MEKNEEKYAGILCAEAKCIGTEYQMADASQIELSSIALSSRSVYFLQWYS